MTMIIERQQVADRIFDNRDQMIMLDDELYQACEAAGISGNHYCDWHFDSYDGSIEFDGCDDDWRLTPEGQAALWKMGFLRCWLNHKDGSETYYWTGGKPEGSRNEMKRAVLTPSPTPEDVERVARAIYEACSGDWDSATEGERQQCCLEARAAIAAMPHK